MTTMKKAQTGAKVVAKKTTVKVTPKKPKSVSERLGDVTLRDLKNSGEDALQLSTLGLYGKVKKALGGEYKHKKIGEKKDGGKISKAKNGKSFPDLNKDGKITKADILKGRGVIAKKGATIKKAQNGTREKVSTVSNLKPRKVIPFLHRAAPNFSRRTLNSPLPSAESILRKKAKSGTSMKTCKGGC